MILFDWTWFGHEYAVGYSFDYTLLVHAAIYGVTVLGVMLLMLLNVTSSVTSFWRSHLIRWPFIQTGLIASMTAALYLEVLQMWQYEWNVGNFFGLADIVVGWSSAILVYYILRRI